MTAQPVISTPTSMNTTKARRTDITAADITALDSGGPGTERQNSKKALGRISPVPFCAEAAYMRRPSATRGFPPRSCRSVTS